MCCLVNALLTKSVILYDFFSLHHTLRFLLLASASVMFGGGESSSLASTTLLAPLRSITEMKREHKIT